LYEKHKIKIAFRNELGLRMFISPLINVEGKTRDI
jgi:hypothetical protein